MTKSIVILIILVSVLGCSSNVPQFDQTKAFNFLEKQCELGPRYPGSKEIELCRELIANQISALGVESERQQFEAEVRGKVYSGENIIASFYPQMSRRIMLAAHYDTRLWADKDPDPANHDIPIIGANDAASGVAVLIEIARVISQEAPTQYGIDLVFFCF